MLPTEHLRDDMTQWRHDFHRHPELGFEEERTSARVADLLESFGIEVHRGIGGTGVVGILRRGNGPGAIAIRADMDALPIIEATGHDYASKTPGKMHACGHDGHTATLLGAAKHLSEQGNFSGTVVFLHQPNEEHGLGAAAMLEHPLFNDLPMDQVFALHNMPGMPLGHVATRPGPMTASEALFEIEITGQGGHAALPHMGVDAITVGAEIVGALQTIVSRKLNPGLNGVVSVTEFVTDGKRNVLPGRATLSGDCRALSSETNARIEETMRRIVDGICAAHGITATVSYETIFPPIQNAPEAVETATRAARAISGQVDANCAPKLFSEDFAHFANRAPGCFLLLGNGTEGAYARPLHSADYDFNDAALVPGSSLWVTLVEQALPAGT